MNATRIDRVLMLTHVFPRASDDPMGAFLLHLADALAERGSQIHVLAPHAPGLPDEETFGAVRVKRFHYAPARRERLAYTGEMHEQVERSIADKILFLVFTLAFFFKTIRVIQSIKPQIIHAHWWVPGGLIGALAARLTRVPLVITTHGTDVEILRRSSWTMPLARFVFGKARVITCGSNYLREQLVQLKVVDAARVSVIPMPVHRFYENPPSAPRDPRLILTVARLTQQKSIDTLLAALVKVRQQGYQARLSIIGDGPARSVLEKQARDLKLWDHVEFMGELPPSKLPYHYASCAVFVLPSVREGMGLVLAEALLCGAPVIAANSGGITDIVKNYETGLLFPERDALALSKAIEKILGDRAFAARLASNGSTSLRERFTREPVAMQFEKIYLSAKNAPTH